MANKRTLQQVENARLGAQTECYVAINIIAGELQRQLLPPHRDFDLEKVPGLAPLAEMVRILAVAARELDWQMAATPDA